METVVCKFEYLHYLLLKKTVGHYFTVNEETNVFITLWYDCVLIFEIIMQYLLKQAKYLHHNV